MPDREHATDVSVLAVMIADQRFTPGTEIYFVMNLVQLSVVEPAQACHSSSWI